jgi:hypothetical protein
MGRTKVTRINIRFVEAFVDRHGKVRHYYRRRGYPRAPSPGLPGSAEFMEAYADVQPCDGPIPVKVATDKLVPGTINAAIIGFYQSPAFLALKAITKSSKPT